jgi:hypothetical protein
MLFLCLRDFDFRPSLLVLVFLSLSSESWYGALAISGKGEGEDTGENEWK